jgi:hypothetical protein
VVPKIGIAVQHGSAYFPLEAWQICIVERPRTANQRTPLGSFSSAAIFNAREKRSQWRFDLKGAKNEVRCDSVFIPWRLLAMRTTKTAYCVVLATGFSLLFVDSAAAIKILMHGREPVPAFADDGAVYNHLTMEYGMENVTYMAGVDAAADGASANGFDVVFISASMASSATRNKYEDSPVGIVCGENALIHDNDVGNFMLSDRGGNANPVADRRKITIVNPSHPLAAGLTGEVTVFDDTPSVLAGGYWWQYGLGGLASGATLIAESVVVPEPAEPQHAIFAAEKDAALLGDGTPGRPMTAAGRRVFFFLSDWGASDLTTEGWTLFDAAVDWAAMDPPVAVPGDYNANGTVDAADYVLWRKNPAGFGGDPDGYNTWRTNFGRTSGPGSALGGGSAVPEPASWFLAVLVAAGMVSLRRSR